MGHLASIKYNPKNILHAQGHTEGLGFLVFSQEMNSDYRDTDSGRVLALIKSELKYYVLHNSLFHRRNIVGMLSDRHHIIKSTTCKQELSHHIFVSLQVALS